MLARKLYSYLYDPFYIMKNSVIFLLGSALFYSLNGYFSIPLLPLLGFVLSYNFIYFMNDLKDYNEDIKDPRKREVKPLLNGSLTKTEAKILSIFYLVSGLLISFSVNIMFFFTILLLLFLNFLHSFFLKKAYFILILNMIIIQFLKVLLGWFSVSPTFSNFPTIFVIFFASSYSLGYLFYKREREVIESRPGYKNAEGIEYIKQGLKKISRSVKGKRTNLFYTIVVIVTFILSFYLYNLRLYMISLFMISITFALLKRFVTGKRMALFRSYNILIVLLFSTILLSFYFITSIPELRTLNQILYYIRI